MRAVPFISKSKYLAGLQCPKLLWVSYNSKEEIPEPTDSDQAIFDQGNLVTEIAHGLFPGGIEVPGRTEYDEILAKTQELLPLRKPLFEPGFKYRNAYARPDILKPNKDGSWDIFEVKSAGKVKDVYYPDIALQKYCYEGAGLKIRKCHVIHINKEYIRRGEIEPKELFTTVDVTDEIEGRVREVGKNLAWMMEVIGRRTRPEIKVGLQCDAPYECPVRDECWNFLPESSIFEFHGMWQKHALEMMGEGIMRMQDVPPERLKTPKHLIQQKSHVGNKPYADPAGLQKFLNQLEFPLHFLDFETIGAAVPVYEGTSPFQQIPFQFSLHILPEWGKKPVHHAFLAENREDPRPEFLKKLKALIQPKGTILAFRMSFEKSCLEKSAEAFPLYQKWAAGVDKRFIDLLVPFQQFHYYDPKQHGSCSIKSVYPALIGKSYDGMTISDGSQANREFGRVTFTDGISEAEKRRVYDGLLEYCKLDTQAMIDILDVLRRASRAQ